jgi:CBS domain-containing protein
MNIVRQLLQMKGSAVWCVSPQDSVYEALRLMAEKNVGALVVTENDKVVGILSERDYARKVVLQGKTSRNVPVNEIMSAPVFSVHPDQTVEECMDVMTRKHIRHLPVIDGEELVGMISIGDVMRDILYRQREELKKFEGRGTRA